MVPINEPVKYCSIIFKYYSWTPDRKDKRWYEDTFENIDQLRAYFKTFPAAAGLVAYGKAPAGSVFAFEAKLILEWADQTSTVVREFKDAWAFAQFLKDHPPIARKVGYQEM